MPQGSRPQYRVLVEKDVSMHTRDGVTLRADVYRPDTAGRFPVLLSRLPYNKNLRPRPGDIDYFVERGYGVIMQDTRGRFSSDGEGYYALIWEMQDGYDAVEWAASLPWADGTVGTMGQSYLERLPAEPALDNKEGHCSGFRLRIRPKAMVFRSRREGKHATSKV